MQIIGDIRDRDISVGITQDIAGGLGDIEIIIVFQCAVSGFGSFAEFCEDGIEPALDMAFIRGRGQSSRLDLEDAVIKPTVGSMLEKG